MAENFLESFLVETSCVARGTSENKGNKSLAFFPLCTSVTLCVVQIVSYPCVSVGKK